MQYKCMKFTQMTSSRIPAPRIVILTADAFERSSLVYGHRAASILVLLARVFYRGTQCREPVRLAGPQGGFGFRCGEIVQGLVRR
jgi:hypothetical protein